VARAATWGSGSAPSRFCSCPRCIQHAGRRTLDHDNVARRRPDGARLAAMTPARVPLRCLKARELPGNAGESQNDTHTREPMGLQEYPRRTGNVRAACHAEGRGFESLQPLSKRPCICRPFSWRSRPVRRRRRTMTGQSCPRRLADALGRCSLAGDSERPAPLELLRPAVNRESTAPGRCSCRTGTPSALSVVAVLPSSRSSTLNLRSCSSSGATACGEHFGTLTSGPRARVVSP